MRVVLVVLVGLAAWLLAACASTGVEDREPPAPPPVSAASENFYQPGVHAILAVSGGFGSAAEGEPIDTTWRRVGSEQRLRLNLSPQKVTVQPVVAGRYVLEQIRVDGRDILVTSDGEKRAAVNDVVLDPDEVVYVGDLYLSRKDGQAGSKRLRLSLRIGRNPARAQAAIADKFERQAAAMKTRLLRRR